MSNNLEYVNTKSKEKIFQKNFNLRKGLSHTEIGELIDSLERYYYYSSYRGILIAEFVIPRSENFKKGKLLAMNMSIAKDLTLEEQNNILLDITFRYNVATGVFTIIHKVTYYKGDR